MAEFDVCALGELTRGKTEIMIAHRLNTIKNANHIIAIENGCVVQEDIHSELIAQNGVYSDFVAEESALQAGDSREL